MEEYDYEMIYNPDSDEPYWIRLDRNYFDLKPDFAIDLLRKGIIRKVPPFPISPTAISDKHNFLKRTSESEWPYGPSVVSWIKELVDLLGREDNENLSDFQIIELLVKDQIKK